MSPQAGEVTYTLTLTNNERLTLLTALEDYQAPSPAQDKVADDLHDRLEGL